MHGVLVASFPPLGACYRSMIESESERIHTLPLGAQLIHTALTAAMMQTSDRESLQQ